MDYTKIYATWWSGNCYHFEQLQALISSTDVKAYAWILHDKCKKEDGSGELKKPHYHYLVQLARNQRGSWFKQFASEDMGLVFYKPVKCAESAYKYLIHDTDKARKEKKFLYDASERTSTIDTFDGEEKLDEHAELMDDIENLLDKKITWREFIRKKPKRIHMIANIKCAHDVIHYETYGFHFHDIHPSRHSRPPRSRQSLPPLSEPKPDPNAGMPEITDPAELARLPW